MDTKTANPPMEENVFNIIWKLAIVPSAQSVIDNISKEVRKKYKVPSISDIDNTFMKRRVYKAYINYNRQIHDIYFNNGKDGSNRIDIHKVCACITSALLENNIIPYDTSMTEQDLKPQLHIVNMRYKVAVQTALYLLYAIRLFQLKKQKLSQIEQLLLKQGCYIVPPVNNGHDNYLVGRIKAIALGMQHDNNFDILAFADMLFSIEVYNFEHIICLVKTNSKAPCQCENEVAKLFASSAFV